MTTNKTKYVIWLALLTSLALLGFKLPHVYRSGDLLQELPFVLLSAAIICSPYLLLLQRGNKINSNKSIINNYFVFSTLISSAGISMLFLLIYVTPDAQNGIAILMLVFIQWTAYGAMLFIESVIKRRQNAMHT